LEFEAQIIAAYGRHLLVRDAEGVSHEARPFGRRVQAVCGDRVLCERDAHHGEIHVKSVLPRRSTLARATLRGTAEAIVANLDLLVTVFAPLPKPDPFIIDRYLCAASSAGMSALVLLNKADLMDASDPAVDEWQTWLAAYRAAGYETLVVSSHSRQHLDALRALLAHRTSAFVGQSGVGKSSLIAALAPETDIATGALDKTEEGRHTTTASRLFDLPEGGALIDSPGVRDYAPAIDGLEPHSLGFPEVDQLATGCKFLDCRHLREPGCAVRLAAEEQRLDARRYESYRRLRRIRDELIEAQGPGKRLQRSPLCSQLEQRLPSCQRVRESAAIDVFELATDRYAVRDARGFQAPLPNELGKKMCSRLSFDGRVGREDDLGNLTLFETRFELADAELLGSDTIERRQMPHQNEIAPAIAT
jgi:ribosome biogenesis GTPase